MIHDPCMRPSLRHCVDYAPPGICSIGLGGGAGAAGSFDFAYLVPGMYRARKPVERAADMQCVLDFADTGESATTNITPIWNRAVAWSASSTGRCVWLPPGVYTALGALNAVSGTRIRMDPMA